MTASTGWKKRERQKLYSNPWEKQSLYEFCLVRDAQIIALFQISNQISLIWLFPISNPSLLQASIYSHLSQVFESSGKHRTSWHLQAVCSEAARLCSRSYVRMFAVLGLLILQRLKLKEFLCIILFIRMTPQFVVHFSYNFNDINIFTHASVTKNFTWN